MTNRVDFLGSVDGSHIGFNEKMSKRELSGPVDGSYIGFNEKWSLPTNGTVCG